MAGMQSHIPSRIIPPTAESRNAALAVAIEKVSHLRWYGDGVRRYEPPDAPIIADAFEAILDLIAPYWRGSPCDDK